MAEDRPDYCPGHEGECKFCKEKAGYWKRAGKYIQIDRKTGEKLVDFCCDKCRKNDIFAKKRSVDPDIAAKLGGRVLRGDRL